MAAKDKAQLKIDNDGTFPSGTGGIVAVDERSFNLDCIDSYLNTSETVSQPMSGDIDMQGNNIINQGNKNEAYSGYDTEANILGMNPTSFLGQVWWATDTFTPIAAVTAIIAGSNVWQKEKIEYNNATDSFELPTTVDGNKIQIGKELIFDGVNDTAGSATELDPKVWKALQAKPGDEDFKNITLVSASDVLTGDVIGINTTSATPGEKCKILMLGDLNGVNTSMWALGQQLYIDDNGLLTNVLPPVNAIGVASVSKVDATDGKLFVNTLNLTRISIGIIPIGLTRAYYTGDTDTIAAGTFYLTETDTKGTTLLATQNVVVDDNQTVAVAQDHISPPLVENGTVQGGFYQGIVQTEIDVAGGEEQIIVEIYLADNDGNVIDSGSGLPNGDLGQPPILVMGSAILDMDSGDIFFNFISGFVTTEVSVSSGQRIRHHTLCSKIGTAGGPKTFTLSYGQNAFTFVDAPSQNTTSLQGAYDVNPLITTSPGIDEIIFKRGTASDSDNVLMIQSGSSAPVVEMNGNGDITMTGTLANLGFNITPAGDATFNSVAGDGPLLTNLPTSLQLAYDKDQAITTSPSNGPIDITRGSASDTDPVFRIFNGATMLRYEANGNGDVAANTLSAEEITAQDTTNDTFDSLIVKNTIGTINFTVKGNGTCTATNFVGDAALTTKSYAQTQNAGVSATQRTKLNFLNASSVVDNPGNDSTDITLPGGGTPTLEQYFEQTRNATQAFNPGVWTTFQPNIAVGTATGTVLDVNTGVITIGAPADAGVYEITCTGDFNVNTAQIGPYMSTRLFINGSTSRAEKRIMFADNASPFVGLHGFSIGGRIRLNNGDTAQLQGQNQTGQIVSLQSGLLYNVTKVGN